MLKVAPATVTDPSELAVTGPGIRPAMEIPSRTLISSATSPAAVIRLRDATGIPAVTMGDLESLEVGEWSSANYSASSRIAFR